MRNFITLKEAKIDTKHPNVKNENADAPPKCKIFIEYSISFETSGGSG